MFTAFQATYNLPRANKTASFLFILIFLTAFERSDSQLKGEANDAGTRIGERSQTRVCGGITDTFLLFSFISYPRPSEASAVKSHSHIVEVYHAGERRDPELIPPS